jgi:hypothetical protein
MLSLIQDKSV